MVSLHRSESRNVDNILVLLLGHSPNVSDIHGTAHTPSKLATIAPHQDIIHGALESPNRLRPSQVQESPSSITPVKMPTRELYIVQCSP